MCPVLFEFFFIYYNYTLKFYIKLCAEMATIVDTFFLKIILYCVDILLFRQSEHIIDRGSHVDFLVCMKDLNFGQSYELYCHV